MFRPALTWKSRTIYHFSMRIYKSPLPSLIVPLLLLSSIVLPCSVHSAEIDLTGMWRGDIDPTGTPIELIFHITSTADGGWSGTVDTPAQNSYALPLSGISVTTDGAITIGVAATGGLYEATLDPEGSELQGTWKQRGAELVLNCKREPLPPPVPQEMAETLTGNWEGILEIGAIELRIVVNLVAHDAGSLSGYMVSPDQSPAEIPVTRVDLLDGDKVRIAVGSAFLSLEMAPSDDGNQLSGSFIQGRGKFDITLEKKQTITGVRRHQEPKPPFPYRAEEIAYDNEGAGVTFAGTLTIPEGDGPFPSVLMITGSGGQDRDETIFQHRPFFVIADHLSRRGIAVLRVDDRGVGGTTAGDEPEKATTEDFVGDALCGVEFLKGRTEIAADRIGLIGHSEGGVIAPMVALRSDDVAFIVMMAGTGIRGDDLLLRQNELIARVSEVEEEKIKEGLELSGKMFAVVLEDSLDEEQMRSRLETILRESTDLNEEEEGVEVESAIASTIDQLMLPWVRWFLRYDPAPTLEKLTCPVLAINGTLDLQVPCKENMEAIEAALKRGKNPDFEMIEFPQLNHLFQHCETGAPSEYGQIEETFSVDVLEKMTNWILHRFGNNKERKVSD